MTVYLLLNIVAPRLANSLNVSSVNFERESVNWILGLANYIYVCLLRNFIFLKNLKTILAVDILEGRHIKCVDSWLLLIFVSTFNFRKRLWLLQLLKNYFGFIECMYAGCYAWWCYPCFTCSLSRRMDECTCGPFCLRELFLLGLRTKLRTQHGIRVRPANAYPSLPYCLTPSLSLSPSHSLFLDSASR